MALEAKDAGALGRGGDGAGIVLAEETIAVARDETVDGFAQEAGEEADEGSERCPGAADELQSVGDGVGAVVEALGGGEGVGDENEAVGEGVNVEAGEDLAA